MEVKKPMRRNKVSTFLLHCTFWWEVNSFPGEFIEERLLANGGGFLIVCFCVLPWFGFKIPGTEHRFFRI